MKAGNKIGIMVCVSALIIGSAVGLRLAGQGTPPDAPAGYDTPTLSENPGSQSHGNGMLADADFSAAREHSKRQMAWTRAWAPCTTPVRALNVTRLQ